MRSILPRLRRLPADEEGAVLAYVTVILAAVFGIGALVVDMGRLSSTQTELQSFADHLALAMAGELDGSANAITRANAMLARGEWQDAQTFANGDRVLSNADVTVRFLSGLPADDTAAIGAGLVTTDPLLAAFVEVTVTPHTVGSWLAGGFNALSGNALATDITTGATAVAGFTQHVCDITPLMFCVADPHTYTPVPGRMVSLKAHGGSGSSWAPGTFGLLDANFDPDIDCSGGTNGASFWSCAVGRSEGVTRCFSRRAVGIRPGSMTGPVAAGINTRFDMYLGKLKNEKNNPDYAPAPNVVKGIGPKDGGCPKNKNEAFDAYDDSDPLPKDTCFGADKTCGGSQFGDGDWDKTGYVDTNHNGAPVDGATRFEVYLDEIANANGGPILPDIETGRPVCNTNPPAGSERRVLIVAVMDCDDLGGNTEAVPGKYVRVFLTEPSGTVDETFESTGNASGEIWVEEIEEVSAFGGGAGGGVGFIHNLVQLYR